jgi:hypothetical protein
MFSMQEVVDQLKPQWTHRRKFVAWLLFFLCTTISVALGGALVLGFFSHFSIYICAFLVVFIMCAFASLLGIIGSYIFGSRWETKDYLEMLPHIMPNVVGDAAQKIETMVESHNQAGQ